MKLLLDEMYPYAIAEGLRDRGHDVVAVGERPELRGVSDDGIFEVAQAESRTLVTENVVDFLRVEAACRGRGESHAGLVLTSNTRFPRGQPRTVGKLVRALHAFLGDAAPALERKGGFTHWLR